MFEGEDGMGTYECAVRRFNEGLASVCSFWGRRNTGRNINPTLHAAWHSGGQPKHRKHPSQKERQKADFLSWRQASCLVHLLLAMMLTCQEAFSVDKQENWKKSFIVMVRSFPLRLMASSSGFESFISILKYSMV